MSVINFYVLVCHNINQAAEEDAEAIARIAASLGEVYERMTQVPNTLSYRAISHGYTDRSRFC